MNILDGDDVRVSYNGHYAERDIVQVICVVSYVTLAVIIRFSNSVNTTTIMVFNNIIKFDGIRVNKFLLIQ